jgi:hypothetical protein
MNGWESLMLISNISCPSIIRNSNAFKKMKNAIRYIWTESTVNIKLGLIIGVSRTKKPKLPKTVT